MLYHLSHTDLDGYGCHLVMEHMYDGPSKRYIANYGDEITYVLNDIIGDIETSNHDYVWLLITDLNLTDEQAAAVEKLRTNKNIDVTLLDHHKTGRDVGEIYEWYNYTEGRSGTRLTYEHMLGKITELYGPLYDDNDDEIRCLETIVGIIDVYDMWRQEHVVFFEAGKVATSAIMETYNYPTTLSMSSQVKFKVGILKNLFDDLLHYSVAVAPDGTLVTAISGFHSVACFDADDESHDEKDQQAAISVIPEIERSIYDYARAMLIDMGGSTTCTDVDCPTIKNMFAASIVDIASSPDLVPRHEYKCYATTVLPQKQPSSECMGGDTVAYKKHPEESVITASFVVTTDISDISTIGNAIIANNSDIDFVININTKKGSVGLRGNGLVDLGEVAKRYFNGGGHRNAAGGIVNGMKPAYTYNDAVNVILKQLRSSLVQTILSNVV